jgi:hypothetical protein
MVVRFCALPRWSALILECWRPPCAGEHADYTYCRPRLTSFESQHCWDVRACRTVLLYLVAVVHYLSQGSAQI